MTQREPETALYETWARDFDLVVAEQYPGHAAPHHSGLDRVILTSDAIRLATPPVGLGGETVSSLADTASMPWVMEPPRGAASRHWAEQACRSAGFEPDVRYETADLQAQIRLIESGNAVALMPDLVWTGRTRTVQLLDLPGLPKRTVFTSTRTAGRIHLQPQPAAKYWRGSRQHSSRMPSSRLTPTNLTGLASWPAGDTQIRARPGSGPMTRGFECLLPGSMARPNMGVPGLWSRERKRPPQSEDWGQTRRMGDLNPPRGR